MFSVKRVVRICLIGCGFDVSSLEKQSDGSKGRPLLIDNLASEEVTGFKLENFNYRIFM